METVLQDIRYGIRMLWKAPGFTLVALVALALGIGANAALFTVINTVLLRPFPYRQPDKLVRIFETMMPSGMGTASAPNFRDWQQQNHSFEHLAAYKWDSLNLQNVAAPERVVSTFVTGDLFPMLGVSAMRGRTLTVQDEQADQPLAVVISSGFWRRRFGGDPNLIGRNITFDAQPYTVVGIMPDKFEFPPSANTEAWVPLRFRPADMKQRGNHSFSVYGRIKPDVSQSAALADLKHVAALLAQQYPQQQAGRSVKFMTLDEVVTGRVRPALLSLMGAVGFVLLIACANVANLLLARAAGRHREIAVRVAMGASRWRLTRQMLTESLLLATVGGGLGFLVAQFAVSALVGAAKTEVPRIAQVHFDLRVFGFLLLVSLAAGVLFGILPAVHAGDISVADVLKTVGAAGAVSGRRQKLFRKALVAVEVALSVVLLIGAGLLVRTFAHIQSVDPGLDMENVVTARLSLPDAKYNSFAASSRFVQPMLERLRATPGVRDAGCINLLPLQTWGWNGDFEIVGRAKPELGHENFAEFRRISPGYFATMRIPIVGGRDFRDSDNMSAPLVTLMNQTAARRYFGSEHNALGHEVIWFSDKPATIVGLVADVHQAGLDRAAEPELYANYLQSPVTGMSIVAAGALPPDQLINAMRNAVHDVDPNQPLFRMATMKQVISDSFSDRHLYMLLLVIFSSIALVLATAGIYGVISYAVSQRLPEFGLRMALGAQPLHLLRLVLGDGFRMVLLGIVAGVAGAAALTRVLERYLFGVKPLDLPTFAFIAVLLALVALLASYVPARRAAKVDPLVALRCE